MLRATVREELRIETAKGEEFVLPFEWSLEGDHSVEMRGNIEDRALSHGGIETGDYKSKSRTLELSFHIQAENRRRFNEAVDEIKRYFTGSDYKLYAGNPYQHFRISRMVKLKQKYMPAFKGTFAEITIGLRCADPFRYSDELNTRTLIVEQQTDSGGVLFEIDSESNVDTPLVISFHPFNVMSEINLASIERKESFAIMDTMLTSENVLTVNGENATVYRDNANAINTFSGTFISLDPGRNTLRYSGAPGTITFTHYARWW